jgi:hypothetical protein
MMDCRIKSGNGLVMRGLDPRSHPLRKTRRRHGRPRLGAAKMMGCRVEPGNGGFPSNRSSLKVPPALLARADAVIE